jgi:hypothetical protein
MHACKCESVHTMIRQPHEAASIVHPYQVWAQRECSRPVINIASSHRSNISVSFQLRTCIGFSVFGLEVRVSASFQVRTCIHVCCVCIVCTGVSIVDVSFRFSTRLPIPPPWPHGARLYVCMCMCVCVCVCVRARAYVCVCVCVCSI